MVFARKAAVLAAVAAAALCVVLDANAASLTPSFSMTPTIACNGDATVTLKLDAQDPPAATRPIDLMYVVDESGSITTANFNQVKSSLLSWASGQVFGPTRTGAGIVMFSTDARLVINPVYVSTSFTSAAGNLYQRGGNTNIGAGIQLATSSLLNYGRPSAQKVIVLETDGYDNVNTSQLATIVANAKAAGITIFTVGVGSGIDATQLNAIASTIPGVQTTYTLGSYSGLTNALNQITTVFSPAATNVHFDMIPASGWQVTGVATATNGSVSSSPGNVQWWGDIVHTGSTTISYTLHHTGTTGGTVAPQSMAQLSWQDDAGQSQRQSFADQTVQVSGCNQPPHADAGPDQTVQLSGARTANVTLNGSGSTDDGVPQALSYSWSEGGAILGTGPTLSAPLGLGEHTITLTVDDGELTDTDTVQVTVVDPTPPVVTPVVTGTLGLNGWYTSDVAVAWTVTDPESDVSLSGCGAASLTQDTASAAFTCSATSAGGTTTGSTGTLKRDATPPTISFAGAQATYALSDTVAISCSAADAVSGVASTTAADVNGPAWQFGAGTVTRSVTATDEAGNVGHGTVSFTVVVTAAGLESLIRQLVSDQGVAKSLVAKVESIASAPNAQAKAGKLQAFDNEVAALTGKALTAANAALLEQFAAAL